MRKFHRERKKLLESEGLEVLEMDLRRRSTHMKFTVRTPDGRIGVLYAAGSPSDRRSQRRFRADARRLLRGDC